MISNFSQELYFNSENKIKIKTTEPFLGGVGCSNICEKSKKKKKKEKTKFENLNIYIS